DRVAAAREDPRADQALAVVVRPPEEGLARVEHIHEIAGAGSAFDGGDLVAEDPRVPGPHTAILILAEEEARRRRRHETRLGTRAFARRCSRGSSRSRARSFDRRAARRG